MTIGKIKRTESTASKPAVKLSEVIGEEMLYRFAYIPLAIGELVWDYADTVVKMAIEQGNSQTKSLSRAVRTLRREYIQIRSRFVCNSQMEEEMNNALNFEDAVNDILTTYNIHLRSDIEHSNPGLSSSSIYLLMAVRQCMLLIKSLFVYVEKQNDVVRDKTGFNAGNILPISIYQLAAVIPEFAGKTNISERFINLQEQYIMTLATQMERIKLQTSKP